MGMLDTMPEYSSRSLDIFYKTTTGRCYPLELAYDSLPSRLIPVNRQATTKACQIGCRLYGRNGGCPPLAPTFSEKWGRHSLFLYAKILTENYPPKVLNGTYYTRWVFVETFLTALTYRIGRYLASELDSYFLGSGHCVSCRPKKCSLKQGDSCRKPDARTYSLEATGVLVTELMENLFGIELKWWRPQEKDYIPEYMLKVIGLVRDEDFGESEVRTAVLSSLQNERVEVQEYNIAARSCSLLSM
jgi:predicted metal-binding protein